MNDRNHSEAAASPAGPSDKHETLVLFEKLEDLRGILRKAGVVRVIAAYEKNALSLAFLNSQDMTMIPPDLDKVPDDLANLLSLIIRRRCPEGMPQQVNSGTFNWHLVDDVLIHQHTVTFRGL